MSVMTTTASLNSVQDAYDRRAYFALRPQLHFDGIADVKPAPGTLPGDVVQFTQYADLAVATAPLDESTDVDTVALSDAHVAVTLQEYGNAIKLSRKLRGTSYLQVDKDAANIVGFNAGVSLDTIARDVLSGGSNVDYAGTATSRNTVKPTDELGSSDVRTIYARLAGANVPTFGNGLYKAFAHPDAAKDLKEETGEVGWRAPHVYSEPGHIWNGSIGAYEGFEWVVTPRAKVVADAGSSTTLTDVYLTLFAGMQAMAKAWSESESGPFPRVELGPVTDVLNRFKPTGWYWLGGYGRFREACLWRVESASSIGDND